MNRRSGVGYSQCADGALYKCTSRSSSRCPGEQGGESSCSDRGHFCCELVNWGCLYGVGGVKLTVKIVVVEVR